MNGPLAQQIADNAPSSVVEERTAKELEKKQRHAGNRAGT
jgi:hypothetical protein